MTRLQDDIPAHLSEPTELQMLDLHFELDSSDLVPGARSTRHLIARVLAPAAQTAAERPPLDLAVVIDASGSMSGPRLEAAQRATAELAAGLPSSTRMTVVSFADDVIVHADRVALDAEGVAEIQARVLGIHPRGCTNLNAGWQTACMLLEEAEAGRQRHVVLLSDGMANRGVVEPELLMTAARQKLDLGITTSCVGVGDGYQTDQLAALAEHGGGELHDAENAAEIIELLLGEVLSLSEICAEDVQVSIALPQGVRALELAGMPSATDGQRMTVCAGSLRAGASRTVVVRVEIDGDMAGNDVAFTAHADWRIPGEQDRLATEAREARAALSDAAPAAPSLEAARAVLTAWQSHLVLAITDLNRRGDRRGIKRTWAQEGPRFRDYARRYPELESFIKMLNQLEKQSAQVMPERMRKLTRDTAWKDARSIVPHYSADKGALHDQLMDA